MHLYLQGLLSHLPRKNAEAIATLIDVERQVMDFVGTALWDHRPLLTVLVGPVAERLGSLMASSPSIRAVFPSAARTPWGEVVRCGHRGKVDNCQVGVFMGHALRTTMPCWTSGCPCPRWARDAQRRAECHVPPECAVSHAVRAVWRCSTRGASGSRTAG